MTRFLVLLVISLLIPTTALSSETFFPIGIWEAQRIPTACGGADSTTLDEIRGGPGYGYESGINAVFCYYHADLNFIYTSPEQVECYLDEAEDLGFKALIKLSDTKRFGPRPFGACNWNIYCGGHEGEYWTNDCDTLSNYPTLYERTPRDTTDHATVIRKVAGHPALLGFYLADEPMKFSSCGGTSAAALHEARATYRTVDDAYPGGDAPYYIAMYDYSAPGQGVFGWAYSDLGDESARKCDWFWDGDQHQQDVFWVYTPTYRQDYSQAADVMIYDTYRGSNQDWRDDLGQLDDLVGGGGAGSAGRSTRFPRIPRVRYLL